MLALLIELIHLRNFLGMMRIHTKKMLPADAGSFKQKEAELSGEYDWKVSFPSLIALGSWTTELTHFCCALWNYLDNTDQSAIKVAESPFLFLTTELPPPPLFKDEYDENIIPQVGNKISPALSFSDVIFHFNLGVPVQHTVQVQWD